PAGFRCLHCLRRLRFGLGGVSRKDASNGFGAPEGRQPLARGVNPWTPGPHHTPSPRGATETAPPRRLNPTNTARHTRSHVASKTPGTPPETSAGDDAPLARRCTASPGRDWDNSP